MSTEDAGEVELFFQAPAGATAAAVRQQRLAAARMAGARPVTRAEYVSTTRRGILGAAAAIGLGGAGWGWVQQQALDGNIPAVLRDGFEWNEVVWDTLFDQGGLAPEFDVARATPLRTNGGVGLGPTLDASTWSLRVVGIDGTQIDDLDLDAVTALGSLDQVTEHKCIEGWSNITHWTGTRFADLAVTYPAEAARARYVSLATPDGEYHIGLSMDSAMHPQTLLAHGLDGQPLTEEHGAPLRLVTPLHYGIKSLKRIGTIRFTTERPADYWAERGYDWHSAH